MPENAIQPSPSHHLAPVRLPGRAWYLRLLSAILVVAIFCGLAYFVREHRDFAAHMAAVLLVFLGFHFAWRFLPVPVAMRARLTQARARWAEEDRRLGETWTRLFRNMMWFGPFCLVLNVFDYFWKTGALRFPTLWEWGYAVAFLVIGLLADKRCRRILRERQREDS